MIQERPDVGRASLDLTFQHYFSLKSLNSNDSAKGAKYESQGQSRFIGSRPWVR